MKNIFNHRPSWTIMDHQRPSVTIRDHQWPSVTIRDHQRSSETIIVNQRPSQTNIASLTITDSTTYFIQSNLYWSFQYHLNFLPKHYLQNHLHTILIVELHLLWRRRTGEAEIAWLLRDHAALLLRNEGWQQHVGHPAHRLRVNITILLRFIKNKCAMILTPLNLKTMPYK